MRLVRLQVAHFGAIERASVELGPGLTVLYGPNDLGKSTLARALRAALLLPHGSTAAKAFTPWHNAETPRASLVFEVDGRFWRVTKTWGRSAAGSSLLEWSNDGVTFSVEEKGRGVDGKLRELLCWGIASPGGKGGKQGLPESFLATVLLGEQAAPYAVLDDSLLSDPIDTGRARLSEALQALAQDPELARVLEVAQQRVDAVFTATGKRKRAKSSPLVRSAEQIGVRQQQWEQLKARLHEAETVSSTLAELDTRRDRLMSSVADGRERLEALERDLARQQGREQADERLRSARARLDEIRKCAEEVQRLQTELAQIDAALPELRAEAQGAAAAREAAVHAAQNAQTKLATLQDEDADEPEARALQKRRLDQQQRRRELQARLEAASRAVELSRQLSDLQERASEDRRELETVVARSAEARGVRAEVAQRRHHLAQAISLRRLQEAEQALAELESTQRQAHAHGERAQTLSAKAAALHEQVSAVTLPDAAALARLEALHDEQRLAEAALGGGVSVSVDLHETVTLRAGVDGAALRSAAERRAFEAERSVELRIGDVATVRVVGGDAEGRRKAEAAARAFADAAAGVFAGAGVEDLDALRAAVERARQDRAQVQRLRAAADAARELRAVCGVDEAAVAAAAQRVHERTRSLKGVDRDAVLASVGDLDESGLQDEDRACERELAELSDRAAEHTSQRAELEARLAMHDARSSELQAQHAATVEPLDEDASTIVERASAAIACVDTELEQLERELQAVVGARAQRIADARRDHDAAAEHAERSRAVEARAAEALTAAGQRRSAAEAALVVRREQLQASDEAAAAAEVERLAAELEALPVPEHAVDPDAIEDAREHLVCHERMLAEVDTEVRKAEGALQQVGGEVVRDKANAARDALDAARREAAELELDYEAWKLLVEVLREAENDEGRHLGEALGGSIGERFGSLTAGRYGRLELGPDLQTQGLRAAGDVRPVETLSEGLKEQLATLLRVAIAEQLCTMLVLDDHLTQTDPARIDWFRDLLREAARTIQIVVLTCRPTDYLQPEELTRDSSDPRSSVCVVDLTAVIRRAEPSGANERV